MYPVSSGYLTAVRGKVRTDRMSGTVFLHDGSTITIDDTVLVKDTLKLTRELCNGKYRIGTFNLACLRFSFFIDDALGLDLTGAYVTLSYGLEVNETFENVPLGKFLIDPVLSIRRKNILSVVAYDEGIKFDVPLSVTLRETAGTPDELIADACAMCGVSTDITAQSVSGLPNSALAVSAGSKQIQTCRDLIMWCAALMCCFAAVDRNSKLVLIPAKYAVRPDDQTIIITDRTVREDERKSINVTDTRAYIKYLTAYEGNDLVNYTSSYISPDEQASPAAYILEKNPLLSEKTAAECGTANSAWLGYIGAFKQRGVEAVLFGDPSMDVGDTVAFGGGDVDQRSGIIGVVTGITWRYRGCQDVECLAAECCGSLASQSSSYFSSDVRRQSEKRIDSMNTGNASSGVGEDLGDHNERFNDYENNTVTGSGSYNHVEGSYNTVDTGYCVHLSGYGNTVRNGARCTVSGERNNALGFQSGSMTGYNNNFSGSYNMIGGSSNNGGGTANIVGGQENTVGAAECIVNGRSNEVSSDRCIVNGYDNVVGSGADDSIVNGVDNVVTATYSFTCGRDNVNSASYSVMCGDYGSNSSYPLAVGGGTSSARSNIFYVDLSGSVYARGSYNTIGADYAEYFEWADGNPENEDRRGMLVSLYGDRVVPAHGDNILGAVSARPSVVGNAYEEYWHGKYKTDVFGAFVTDKDGKPILSADYDPNREYIPRSKRPEWAAIGLVGRLIVADNGKCVPGGYVSARSGKAVPTLTQTKIMCLKRIDSAHIEILVR